jgi:hypothetical protein
MLKNRGNGQCLSARSHRVERCASTTNTALNQHYTFYSNKRELMLSDVDTCTESPLGALPSEITTWVPVCLVRCN